MTQLAAFDRHLPQDVATDSRALPENPEVESGPRVCLAVSGEVWSRTARPDEEQPECRTPEQMKMANAFCRYLEMATAI
jgi:hypothetical protein